MKPSDSIGILGYGAYIPCFRLPTSEVGRVWRGGGSGPGRDKAVANMDEDSATMAVEAAKAAVQMAEVREIGAVFVGTESKPYAVKPTSTIVAQALGQHETLAADFEFACKAGTEAMQVIMGLIGSKMIKAGLAIGVDTAQGRPGDELEYTAGSGAAAFLLSKSNSETVARIEGSVSYVSDTCDFWRRSEDKYPKHLSRFTGEPAYFHHSETAVKMLFKEFGYRPEDFKYAVFHQPNPRFPIEVGQRLGFTLEQLKTGLLNPYIGNTYSASALLGLIAVLDEAEAEDKVLLASFGSGAGSDAIVLTVQEAAVEKRRRVTPLKELILTCLRIDYALYAKFRDKLRM